jgi:hypothetical protein
MFAIVRLNSFDPVKLAASPTAGTVRPDPPDSVRRATLTVGLVTSALAMLVAVLSLGALLAPTFVAAAIALMATRRGAHTRAAPDEPQPSQQRGVAPLAGRLADVFRCRRSSEVSCPEHFSGA